MSADTEALLATVREHVEALVGEAYSCGANDVEEGRESLAALTSLAAELERVKAERDGFRDEAAEQQMRWLDEQARLDKALAALREIDKMERTSGYRSLPEAPVDFARIARAAIAEIGGEA